MLYNKLKEKYNEIKELTKLGVVPTTVIRNIDIYDSFLMLQEKKGIKCKICRYEIIAEDFGFSGFSCVRDIVLRMEK